ncbi:zinc finger protein 771-like [Coregonus clupeaformis]|uniref:zinc finger protein 771-like n=1 Tax=Coregonus clupeaformis TaxID=59861 RepID=UPI001E1C7786|nr:zinc finger protein 771-like [Coregonus clupeaformis]
MSSLNYSPPAKKEEEVCWTEKQGLWLNVVVKEEEEEEDVTVKGDEEAFRVKEEDEEEITVTLKEEDEDETGDLINTRERPDSHSDSGKSPSGESDPETPKPARRHDTSHCGKSFKRLWTLKEHGRTHTREKLHHCSDCGKSFTQLGQLRTHERAHTGEKPYHCSHCEKSFPRWGA